MERPTLVTRFFMQIVGWVEHLNLTLDRVGNPPIYDKAIFPWTRVIESEWRTNPRHFDHVLTRKDELPGFHELATDVSAISQDRGWKTFLLAGYGFSSANISASARRPGALPEHPRADHGDVLDPRAGQAPAAAPRAL